MERMIMNENTGSITVVKADAAVGVDLLQHVSRDVLGAAKIKKLLARAALDKFDQIVTNSLGEDIYHEMVDRVREIRSLAVSQGKIRDGEWFVGYDKAAGCAYVGFID